MQCAASHKAKKKKRRLARSNGEKTRKTKERKIEREREAGARSLEDLELVRLGLSLPRLISPSSSFFFCCCCCCCFFEFFPLFAKESDVAAGFLRNFSLYAGVMHCFFLFGTEMPQFCWIHVLLEFLRVFATNLDSFRYGAGDRCDFFVKKTSNQLLATVFKKRMTMIIISSNAAERK